jgi:hypothetical protein
MAGKSGRSRRTARRVLIGLVAVGLAWATPAAAATAQASNLSAHRPELIHASVPATVESVVVAPPGKGLAAHQVRGVDAAPGVVAPATVRLRAVTAQLSADTGVTAAYLHSSAARAPPLRGHS